jgi:hypothetical protein
MPAESKRGGACAITSVSTQGDCATMGNLA